MPVSKRVTKEFQKVSTEPPEWLLNCTLVADDLRNWRAKIAGPENTPYAEGKFVISVEFPAEYPFKPPVVKFLTKVYHPNVKSDGQICTQSFPWSPQSKAVDFLLLIRQLLEHPSEDSPLEAAIGEEYKNNRAKFDKKAREQTLKHAK